ncbi:hypothetical protein JXB01_03265 [Candidatus Micrarchaeota archaeon]|nr:hypothetical protein [Candidatus Micrarchaeota archaeon]
MKVKLTGFRKKPPQIKRRIPSTLEIGSDENFIPKPKKPVFYKRAVNWLTKGKTGKIFRKNEDGEVKWGLSAVKIGLCATVISMAAYYTLRFVSLRALTEPVREAVDYSKDFLEVLKDYAYDFFARTGPLLSGIITSSYFLVVGAVKSIVYNNRLNEEQGEKKPKGILQRFITKKIGRAAIYGGLVSLGIISFAKLSVSPFSWIGFFIASAGVYWVSKLISWLRNKKDIPAQEAISAEQKIPILEDRISCLKTELKTSKILKDGREDEIQGQLELTEQSLKSAFKEAAKQRMHSARQALLSGRPISSALEDFDMAVLYIKELGDTEYLLATKKEAVNALYERAGEIRDTTLKQKISEEIEKRLNDLEN